LKRFVAAYGGKLTVSLQIWWQEVFGPRPNRIILELEKETQKYHEAHSMASESNLTLNKAMRLHVKNLRLLSLTPDQLEAEIPTLAGPYKVSHTKRIECYG
jgi:tyrosine-protein phosphatase non-receptor type 23